MNVQLFQQIAEQLLQKHFGLSLNDTRLSEPEYVKVLVDGNCRPVDYINEYAVDCDLARVDIEGFWGTPSHVPLTAEDEKIAMSLVSGEDKVVVLNDRYADSLTSSPAYMPTIPTAHKQNLPESLRWVPASQSGPTAPTLHRLRRGIPALKR